MRAKRLGVTLTVAMAFVAGCLDSGGGPQDQWMNTDAYVAPEVGSSSGHDGGVTCTDAPAFGSPTSLGEEPDGGRPLVQYGVAMAGSGNDGGAVNVAWLDRDLAFPTTGDVRAARVPAGASTGAIVDLQRPTGCDILTDPALAVSKSGTVILVATCITGSELAASETQILAYRSTDGLESFADPIQLADCRSATEACGYPSVAARGDGAVLFAWTDWTIDQGTTTAIAVKVWRSDDDGLTAPTEITLPGTFAATGAPRLTVDPYDAVHLAFNGSFSLGGTSYVGYAKLAATDTAFSTPEVLGPGADTPRIAASGEGVYVVWPGGTSGSTLEEAHNTGAGFMGAKAIGQPTGTTAVVFPAVATDPDGNVHLFWMAVSDAGLTTYYSVSTDQGASWLDPLLISGPFDGITDIGGVSTHQNGAVDLVATGEGVTLGWGDPMTADVVAGVTSVYLARRVCP